MVPTMSCLSLCMCAGLIIAAVADTQLHAFCSANEAQQRQGKPPKLILDTGKPHMLTLVHAFASGWD